ncbi:MAG: phosphonate C-P lyase system protein PhnG [Desulfobulbaceae bacterium]|mgnify:CR=1 FL=1|nr:MAG: phosphonate C-P lyase system protein PhnG [Desulfobulbaceae bacterium]
MTKNPHPITVPDGRPTWHRALNALEPAELSAEIEPLTNGWQITLRALPQSGLAMLKIRESACAEPFYLGETPLSTAWLTIRTPDGLEAEGAAQVMTDNLEQARTMAICDAILSARLPGHELVSTLVGQGWQRCQAADQKRKAMLTATRVDFSLLDDVGESHED